MSVSKKLALVASSSLLFVIGFASLAFADPNAAAQAAEVATKTDPMNFIAAGIAIGIAACGCGVGQGIAARGALEGIARNPAAYGKIFTPMIIALALIESLSIYALLVSLLAIFA